MTFSGRPDTQLMAAAKLQLAHQKTEIMFSRNCKKAEHIEVDVNGERITSTRKPKYLGVILDGRLNVNNHVHYICKKEEKTNVFGNAERDGISQQQKKNVGKRHAVDTGVTDLQPGSKC